MTDKRPDLSLSQRDVGRWERLVFKTKYKFYTIQRERLRKKSRKLFVNNAAKGKPAGTPMNCDNLGPKKSERYIELGRKQFDMRTVYMGWVTLPGDQWHKGGKDREEKMGILPHEAKPRSVK